MFSVLDEHRIAIAHIASPGSVRNAQTHPQVCVSFVDVFSQRGFKVYGRARYLAKDEADCAELLPPLRAMAGEAFPIHGVILVEAERTATIVAPSYPFVQGTTEASQRASAIRTYEARPRLTKALL